MKATKETLLSISKLLNLKNALADCGVETKFTKVDGMIILNGTLWNCVNGNEEPFSFYIEEDDTIQSYIDPKTDNKILLKTMKNW